MIIPMIEKIYTEPVLPDLVVRMQVKSMYHLYVYRMYVCIYICSMCVRRLLHPLHDMPSGVGLRLALK